MGKTVLDAMLSLQGLASLSGDIQSSSEGILRFIETGMSRDLPAAARDYFNQRTPMNRTGQPEEVAKVVLFLCSEGASYMNGAVGAWNLWVADGKVTELRAVPVDGGLLVR